MNVKESGTIAESESIPTFADIEDAARRLAPVATKTPVMTSRTFNALVGSEVFFKCENFQRGGSFKFRGAYNRLSRLTEAERRQGIIAFSSGNHAQGVALAAQLLGIPAVIVMPFNVPAVKLAATKEYGAEVIVFDPQTTNREELTLQLSLERGLTVVPPFNNRYIIAGQGTASLELLTEIPDLDILVTPAGGGGLLSGCALATNTLRPGALVYGVEAHGADDIRQSLQEGRIVTIPIPATIADGIRTQAPGTLTFPLIQRFVRDIVLVSDAEIIDALHFTLTRMKLVVEPTGVVAMAALLQHRIPDTQNKRIGVILSGGNFDLTLPQLV